MTTAERTDRAALVRRALVELVAERGFSGTSMASVAERAGVATGTAYVHYTSKDDLVLAAYVELKADLGLAATGAIDRTALPSERFRLMWFAIRNHLAANPERARFLVQVEMSPYADAGHAAAMAMDDGNLLEAVGADMLELFVDLPGLVLYDLSIGPLVRLIASGDDLETKDWERLCTACWRAVTAP